MKTCMIVASFAAVAYGGSVELVSGDLSGGNKALDNIKAKWSQRCAQGLPRVQLAARPHRAPSISRLCSSCVPGVDGRAETHTRGRRRRCWHVHVCTLSLAHSHPALLARWMFLPPTDFPRHARSLKVLGNAATVTGSYDRSENENFLNEATLTGSVGKGKVDYELTTKFNSGLDYEVSTKTDDGSSISMEGSVDLLSASDIQVRKVSASKTTNLRGNDYDVEISHDLGEGESKIKMSTVLGAGVKAIGTLTNKGGATSKVRARPPPSGHTRRRHRRSTPTSRAFAPCHRLQKRARGSPRARAQNTRASAAQKMQKPTRLQDQGVSDAEHMDSILDADGVWRSSRANLIPRTRAAALTCALLCSPSSLAPPLPLPCPSLAPRLPRPPEQGYEVEYDTTLNEGRTLSASINPDAGSGEIEYVDSSTLDGTLTATIPLGGSPSVTFKRSFGF